MAPDQGVSWSADKISAMAAERERERKIEYTRHTYDRVLSNFGALVVLPAEGFHLMVGSYRRRRRRRPGWA